MPEPFDEVLEPQQDPGLHHDRRVNGGMPIREDDDALERLVEEDRVAAGVVRLRRGRRPAGHRRTARGDVRARDPRPAGPAGDTTVDRD